MSDEVRASQHAAIEAVFDEVEKVIASVDPALVEQMAGRLAGPRAVAHAFIDEHVPFDANPNLHGSAAWCEAHPERVHELQGRDS